MPRSFRESASSPMAGEAHPRSDYLVYIEKPADPLHVLCVIDPSFGFCITFPGVTHSTPTFESGAVCKREHQYRPAYAHYQTIHDIYYTIYPGSSTLDTACLLYFYVSQAYRSRIAQSLSHTVPLHSVLPIPYIPIDINLKPSCICAHNKPTSLIWDLHLD
jgi:hypothetical protein